MKWKGQIDFDKPITIVGKPHGLEHITTLTVWGSSDEGRLVHTEDTDKVWFGTSSEWVEITPGGIAAHDHNDIYYTETEIDNFFEGETGGKKQVDWTSLVSVPTTFTPSSHDNTAHSATYITAGDVTFENLSANGDVGTGADQLAVGSHNHDTVYFTQTVLSSITDSSSGADQIGVTASGNLVSETVQSALEELQGDVDNILNGTLDLNHSLDDAYDDGSVIDVDSTNVDFQLTDTFSFKITSDSGTTNILNINADTGGDSVTINGSLDMNGGITLNGDIIPDTTGSDLGDSTHKFGNIWAQTAHFDTSTIYLGDTHQIKVDSGKIQLSNDGSNFYDVIDKNTLETPGNVTIDYTDLANVPTEFTPSAHTHDDRYYTETEINTNFISYTVLADSTTSIASSGYQEVGLSTTSGSASGLSDSTQYYFYVNAVEYNITTGTSPTISDVVLAMDTVISGAGFSCTFETDDIRITNTTTGSSSTVTLSAGTSGTDLFSSLTGFTAFDTAVNGTDLDTTTGSDLIGCEGISGVTPSGGSSGDAGTLQAMLEGIVSINNIYPVVSAIPSDTPTIGTVRIYDNEVDTYAIYVYTSSGWKSISLS